jgi:transcriptional regulator with XRE-family HTH domain
MSFRERFQRAAAYAKVEWSPTAIGASLTLNKQTVARWMDEKNPGEPSGATLFKIADRWKVDARWLTTGEGNMIPRLLMEPGAEYRAFSEQALELARAFDELQPLARDHLQLQMQFLRAAQGASDSPGALQYETSRVRKGTADAGIGRRGKRKPRKKT